MGIRKTLAPTCILGFLEMFQRMRALTVRLQRLHERHSYVFRSWRVSYISSRRMTERNVPIQPIPAIWNALFCSHDMSIAQKQRIE